MSHFDPERTMTEPAAAQKMPKWPINNGLLDSITKRHCVNSVQQLKFFAPKPHNASTLSASASANYSLAG
ncbi:hypothetical protein [Pseudomonas lini]